MIIVISNNPAWTGYGNEGDTRELEVLACEFFENPNYDYTQIVVAWMVTCKDEEENVTATYPVACNSNDWEFNYEALKEQAQETCEFVELNWWIKAQACEVMTPLIVAQFDAQGLFNNPMM